MITHSFRIRPLAVCLLAVSALFSAFATAALAAPPVPLSQYDLGPAPKPIVRLFWQDRESAQLHWGDVMHGSDWNLAPASIEGFPQLDAEQQDLVQMEAVDRLVVVGVRDNQNGALESGWVAIESGVTGHSHGDHFDWQYNETPRVIAKQLDKEQGNPAHLYLYDERYYLANDSLNGLTQIDPIKLRKSPRSAAKFFAGGGNHITMAALDHQVCYSSWIDGGGPNGGRGDVVDLRKPGKDSIAYSFNLPSGVIHGAIANSDRVFFAPADGICWVDADPNLKLNSESVQINHIDLGEDEVTGKPHRTGSFTNYRNCVLFKIGAGATSALCYLNAKDNPPEVVKVPIDVPDGLSLTPPQAVYTAAGKHYAMMFQDRKAGETEEKLTIVDLDPDGNRVMDDARVIKSIPVAASNVQGHYGHHAIAFDDDRKWGFITNPGAGSIWVLNLTDLEIVAKFEVDGKPDHILAVGAVNPH